MFTWCIRISATQSSSTPLSGSNCGVTVNHCQCYCSFCKNGKKKKKKRASRSFSIDSYCDVILIGYISFTCWLISFHDSKEVGKQKRFSLAQFSFITCYFQPTNSGRCSTVPVQRTRISLIIGLEWSSICFSERLNPLFYNRGSTKMRKYSKKFLKYKLFCRQTTRTSSSSVHSKPHCHLTNPVGDVII